MYTHTHVRVHIDLECSMHVGNHCHRLTTQLIFVYFDRGLYVLNYAYWFMSTLHSNGSAHSFEVGMKREPFVDSFPNESISYHEIAIHYNEVNVRLSVPLNHLCPVEFGFLSSIGHHRGAELASTTSHDNIGVHLTSPVLKVSIQSFSIFQIQTSQNMSHFWSPFTCRTLSNHLFFFPRQGSTS